MPTVAYIANEFPTTVEWYISEEVRELRRRGVTVVACSAARPASTSLSREESDLAEETLYLRPVKLGDMMAAGALCIRNAWALQDLFLRVAWEGHEPLARRLRALAHTLLGAVLARRLRDAGVEHIHAHHGYYASWIAMVAARLLGIRFSLSLHGSDLLVNGSYLDVKLEHSEFCRTISEFNRQHILVNFPMVPAKKILVERLGVDVPVATVAEVREDNDPRPLRLLAVGRLHAVKNHQFLVRACYLLRESGVAAECWIVGEGPERRGLEFLIGELHLEDTVRLVGAVSREQVGRYYEWADLAVLTSRSEGIPLVLMEAMARARVVLAPAITGIPELVIDGKTGFLYQPGDLEGFVWRVDQIGRSLRALSGVRRTAREHVRLHFERKQNLQKFAGAFLERIGRTGAVSADENPVLQQV
jgi:colanic acid/amylovoran biosynthesis glycosyltransferase